MSVAGLGCSLLFWEQSDHSIFHTFPERRSGKLTRSFWVIPSFAPLRDPSCSVSLVIFSGSVALWVERQNASWRRYREIFGVRSQWHTYSQHSSVNMLWPRFHNNMAALCEFSLPNLFENARMTCSSINASGELGCTAFFVFPIVTRFSRIVFRGMPRKLCRSNPSVWEVLVVLPQLFGTKRKRVSIPRILKLLGRSGPLGSGRNLVDL